MDTANSSAQDNKAVLAAAVFGILGINTSIFATWALIRLSLAGVHFAIMLTVLAGGLTGVLAAFQAFRYARHGEVWRMSKLRVLLILFMVLYSTGIVLLVVG